jgi:sensitive to high expression protein 9
MASDSCTEKLVKARRQAIEEAKQALDAAHAQQGASQKEVVSLLERKHSWSATDLERYMSLIRSEHLNDQAIREAKDAVLAAENALEEARAQLEKRERAQYHEEQIWSDTIRRNSTWVTFGLMGLNILLLLVNLVIIEPWRRRKMVREIKAALEEAQKPVAVAPLAPRSTSAIEAEIGKVVEPIGAPLEDTSSEATPPETTREATTDPKVAPLGPESTEPVPNETAEAQEIEEPTTDASPTLVPDAAEEVATTDIEAEVSRDMTDMTPLEKITARLEDLVSDEEVSVRKKDLTATICASAAAGYVCAIVAFWLLGSR